MRKCLLKLLRTLGLYSQAKEIKDRILRHAPWTARHRRELVRFYAQFVHAGALCFDIGAHTGERTRIFLELGARVVCVEPQRSCVQRLQQSFGDNPDVTIVGKAVGEREGYGELAVCAEAPEVSTMSRKWREEGRFAQECQWSQVEQVPVTTLDALLLSYGQPDLIKIDVEGMEASVVRGLTRPVPVLSLEFTREFFDDACTCVDHLLSIGPLEVNCTVGDSTELLAPAWVSPAELYQMLAQLDDKRLWGDIYVRFLAA